MAKMGTYKNPHFAIRIPKEKLDKLKYIAEYNARSANKEIEFLVTKHIEMFEKEHGSIHLGSE
ncbi:TPA: Arc family DNA-binding protein [Clostridioides difficile]|uniref:Arc family DNA-binding protein n=1 Tax=Clostridioides difficile TaxID=1496 RepID=UPI00038D404B|nr:Arc family DNA-binding protein [Clostridioides difficile]OFU50077.1 hypothetical protein HMPREF3071_01275 [Clostridium sp. HMSC19A11]EGT3661267.1 Arc family DNA-binding protein [Clostridioides difficile]EGT3688750.1 Arc family DNA-binding protein [Clostridioides difficile]EGT5490786.1 Arc family DNA-binding protein [Clostridioides difficile]EGT5565274.1 Arc family DNA-binding protein [Clostridioides difficile]